MPESINVHLLPVLVTPEQLAGRTVVVIDVLRATTTIVHALAAGAGEIVPCLEVEQARELAARQEEQMLLGGERDGVMIDGFDLGNSPFEYTADKVAGRRIAFTTTNGAKAMTYCRQAARVLIGAFVNFSALCRALADADRVDLLCAGTRGEVTREDVLLAGAIADDLLTAAGDSEVRLNDQAQIVVDAWHAAHSDVTGRHVLAEELRRSQGGRNMLELGQDRDIDVAAEIDKYDLVPELDISRWCITVP